MARQRARRKQDERERDRERDRWVRGRSGEFSAGLVLLPWSGAFLFRRNSRGRGYVNGTSQSTRVERRRSAVCLSAEANRKAVSFPATPRVAVVLRVSVRVAAVHQDRAADHGWVVEALHGELGAVLERDGRGRQQVGLFTTEENDIQKRFNANECFFVLTRKNVLTEG